MENASYALIDGAVNIYLGDEMHVFVATYQTHDAFKVLGVFRSYEGAQVCCQTDANKWIRFHRMRTETDRYLSESCEYEIARTLVGQ